MRYILDDNGYIEAVSCTPFNCKDKSCKEYTGAIPTDYNSIEEWATTANIRAYYLVDGNLTLDAARAAELEAEWEKCSFRTNISTARLTDNYTIATANTYELLPLKEWLTLGNKLSVRNDGSIVIGKNVKYIKVNATMRWRAGTVGQKYLLISKNGTDQLMQISNYRASTSGHTIYVAPTAVFEVKEGDTIGMYAYGSANDGVGGSTLATGQLMTYLTVEVVE